MGTTKTPEQLVLAMDCEEVRELLRDLDLRDDNSYVNHLRSLLRRMSLESALNQMLTEPLCRAA